MWRSIKNLKSEIHRSSSKQESLKAKLEYVTLLDFCEKKLYEVQTFMDIIESRPNISYKIFLQNVKSTISSIDIIYNEIF